MDAEKLLNHARQLKADGIIKTTAYNVARELIDRASDQWTVMLTREEACALCGVTHWGSARRLLNKLQDAGFIGLHTNMRAYIFFLEPPADEPDRAESARQRAEMARDDAPDLTESRQNGAPARQNGADRAKSARQRAKTARLPRDWDQGSGMGREIDPMDPIPSHPVLEGGQGETAKTAPKVRDSAQKRRGQAIPPAEQARSMRLLTDPEVGLGERNALQVAEQYPFAAIRAQTFRFLRDRADGKARSAGCIPQRLAQPARFPAAITEADRASPLWQRHHTEEETAEMETEERQQKYAID